MKEITNTPGLLQVVMTKVAPLSQTMDKIIELQKRGYSLSYYSTYGNDEEMRIHFVYVGEVNSDKARLITKVEHDCSQGKMLDNLAEEDIKIISKGHAWDAYPDKYNDQDHYKCWVFEVYDERTGVIQDVVLIDDGNGYYTYYDYVR